MAESDSILSPWFHGNISREKAERFLNGSCNGTFLIRNSTNFPGDYTLCIASESKVEHYRIYYQNNQFTCDHEELFDSLSQLVLHYKRDSDGLCHRLTTPYISESFKFSLSTENIEEQRCDFHRAGLIIAYNDLVLGSVIGHGEFGDVLSGIYKNKKVAIKVPKGGMSSDLLAEAHFMINLRHKNLVELIGIVMDDTNDVYMLTEYMANGNLVDFLRSRGRQLIDSSQLIYFARDVAQGMQYMEAKNFVHRDLAARNILLDDNMIAKISDFGLAKIQSQAGKNQYTSRGKFPVKWTAPEALRHSQFTNKSDVWSYGVLLWEIFSYGRVPYPRVPIQDVVKYIEKGYRMDFPENTPPAIAAIMADCWIFDPNQRPTFDDLLLNMLKINANL